MTWNVSPILLELGPVAIRWYGLLFAISFYLGHRITRVFFAERKVPLALVDPLLITMMVGTVVGARLGHTLFYEPEIYLAHPLEILKVWQGGLASHGAAIGIFLALGWFCRKHRMRFLWLCDQLCVPIILAGGLIRTGNLFNSEIVGRPTTVPWAIVFSRVDQQPRHPTQVYEALAYFSIFGLLWFLRKRAWWRDREGAIFGLYLALVFGFRFCIEFLKENQVPFESALPLNMGQMLSVPLVAGGLYFVFRDKRPAHPPIAVAEKPARKKR